MSLTITKKRRFVNSTFRRDGTTVRSNQDLLFCVFVTVQRWCATMVRSMTRVGHLPSPRVIICTVDIHQQSAAVFLSKDAIVRKELWEIVTIHHQFSAFIFIFFKIKSTMLASVFWDRNNLDWKKHRSRSHKIVNIMCNFNMQWNLCLCFF